MRLVSADVYRVVSHQGLLWLAAPWALGLAVGGLRLWLPIVMGIVLLVYTVFTDYSYKLGLAKGLALSAHAGLELAGGLWPLMAP
jgi:hypothetical protein